MAGPLRPHLRHQTHQLSHLTVDERGFVTNEHRYLAVATTHGRQIR